jgi:hypothetical protein
LLHQRGIARALEHGTKRDGELLACGRQAEGGKLGELKSTDIVQAQELTFTERDVTYFERRGVLRTYGHEGQEQAD